MRFSDKLVQRLRAWGTSKSGGSTTHYTMAGRKVYREEHWNEGIAGSSKIDTANSSLYKKTFHGKALGKHTYSRRRVKLVTRGSKKRVDNTRWWRPDPEEVDWNLYKIQAKRKELVDQDIPDDTSEVFEGDVEIQYLENKMHFEPIVRIQRGPFQDAERKVQQIPRDDTLLVIYDNGSFITWNLREFLLEKMEGATILSPGVNFPHRKEYKKIVFPHFSYHGDKRQLYKDYFNRWALATDHFLIFDRDLRNQFVDSLIISFMNDARPKWQRSIQLLDPNEWTFLGFVPEQVRADWP